MTGKVECYGGPCDGRIVQVSQKGDAMSMFLNPDGSDGRVGGRYRYLLKSQGSGRWLLVWWGLFDKKYRGEPKP